MRSMFYICIESHDPIERNCNPLQLCKDACRGKDPELGLELSPSRERERERLGTWKKDGFIRGVQTIVCFPSFLIFDHNICSHAYIPI